MDNKDISRNTVPETKIEDILAKVNNQNNQISLINLSEFERRQLIDHLRGESSYKYIQDRETKQLLLAEAIIQEKERVFKDVDLTATEQQLMDYSKAMYECA